MIIEQMLVGPMIVFCYIIECDQTGKCVLIDPAGDEERILLRLKEKELDPVYLINTHNHSDHISGNKFIVQKTGVKVIMHEDDARRTAVDLKVKDGDKIQFGYESLEVIHTPGHTPGGICLYGMGNIFTGDTLFVGAVGRTDLSGGSEDVLLHSLQFKIMPLPDETIVWPGHDYGSRPNSTIGWEKKTNPYLNTLCQQ
jgi:hydroxyacylglutathione hydrolase